MSPIIANTHTRLRASITPEEKLVVTLRYMATGESFESLHYQYRIHRSTIAQFIELVCMAIFKQLAPDYMKMPESEAEWFEIINMNRDRWQFPNCFAAGDFHVYI